MTESPIRKRLWNRDNVGGKEVGEQARDLGAQFQKIPQFVLITLQGYYTEPMSLAVPFVPYAIQLMRIRNAATPGTYTPCGSLCHFLMNQNSGSAQILGIDGLSPTINANITYVFDFMVVGQVV